MYVFLERKNDRVFLLSISRLANFVHVTSPGKCCTCIGNLWHIGDRNIGSMLTIEVSTIILTMHLSNIKISTRELQILRLMSDGLTSREIGEILSISNLTVDKHKSNMISKFQVRNAVQMVVQAERLGMLSGRRGCAFTDIFTSSVS